MVGLLNLAMPTVSVVFGDVGCWLFEFSLARSGGLGSFPKKEWGTRVFPQKGVGDSGLSPERSGGLGSFPRKEWGTRVFPQKAPKVGVFRCVSSCPVSLLPLTAVEPGGSGPVRDLVMQCFLFTGLAVCTWLELQETLLA